MFGEFPMHGVSNSWQSNSTGEMKISFRLHKLAFTLHRIRAGME